MTGQPNSIFFPSSYPELFSLWNRHPEGILFAGGTGLLREQGRQVFELPSVIFSLDTLEELHRISRTERFLEIGAMVKINQIIELGKTVPLVLRRCLESIAGPQLRNMATIGGNICFPGRRLDSSAALCALDARFELRNDQGTRWVSAPRFFASSETKLLHQQELLTRIRIPLDTWDYTSYRKFEGDAIRSRVVVFLAKIQKNVLGDIKIVYKTDLIWRDRDSESLLIGKHLPLGRRIASDFIEHWQDYLSGIHNMEELSRQELVNFIETNVYNLSE